MMQTDWMNALLGGVFIGIAVTLMLYWNGRVTGISGIVNGILSPLKGDTLWRVFFVGGLVMGGVVIHQLRPELFLNTLNSSFGLTSLAGLMVGFGTILGSGCTSGHGVCGISRLSLRSVIATVVFIGAGIVTVALLRQLGVFV